jgi:Holliday junction DNA helicase RuvA
MIAAITGELRRVNENSVYLQGGQLIYEVLVPAADLAGLQARIGKEIVFHTIFDLEGDASRGSLSPRLIGFLRPQDKAFFQLFITVKGIGPKRALRALVQPTGLIAQAIESKNARFLVELPEIGKRTAEQIIAELAGKMTAFAAGPATPGAAISARSSSEETAIEGAMALGISRPDAERLLDRAKPATGGPATIETLLKEMLRLRSQRG